MSGGAEGTRTPNPRLAKAVLCQLSYGPEPGGRPLGGPYGRYRRSGAVVASCQRARSSLEFLTRLTTIAVAPTTPMTTRSFFHMGGSPKWLRVGGEWG